jgi:DNA primase
MYYTKESIEELKRIADPKEVLIHIGGVSPSHMSDGDFEIRCPCPLHSGDNNTGFSWRKHEGMWTCFTKKCGENGSRDVYGFIMQKMNVPFKEAVEILANMFGFDLQKGDSSGYSDYLIAAEARKDYNALKPIEGGEVKILESLPGYYQEGMEYVKQYLKLRNYTDESIISTFQFYPCLDPYGILRMGIPAYDEDGNLVGVNARRMDGVLAYPETIATKSGNTKVIAKYDMIANFKKGLVLFNLVRAKEFAGEYGIIVVEGELSAVRMYSYGFKNVVALRGASITSNQAKLLYKHCFNVVFLVESGEAAESGVIKSFNKLPGMKIRVARLESGDPDDNSKEQVVQSLENSRLYSSNDIQWCIDNGRLL